MPLPLVIINPTSANGATVAAWPSIASDLRAQFGPFSCVFTKQAGEGTQLAAEAARKGIELIIACGGDGTISEVGNGILLSGKNATLGILPSGTGGDFRRTLEIPTRPRDAAEILRNGRTREIDVGRVTFTTVDGEQESRFFLGVASFGMSADVIERVKEGGPAWLPKKAPKWLSGRVTFGASMLRTAMQNPATRVIVQLDDEVEHHLTVANLCIANARYFGGGMKIAPDAKLDDGEFDVISVGDIGALKILTSAPRLYLGSHLSMKDVGHARAAKVVARPVKDDEAVMIEVDGELPGVLPATFQILPRALRVCFPR
ncbi:MAG: diacylglycerol kinase family protein [bacterium]